MSLLTYKIQSSQPAYLDVELALGNIVPHTVLLVEDSSVFLNADSLSSPLQVVVQEVAYYPYLSFVNKN